MVQQHSVGGNLALRVQTLAGVLRDAVQGERDPFIRAAAIGLFTVGQAVESKMPESFFAGVQDSMEVAGRAWNSRRAEALAEKLRQPPGA